MRRLSCSPLQHVRPHRCSRYRRQPRPRPMPTPDVAALSVARGRQPMRSPLERFVTLNASLEQLITPLSTPSPSPCFHRRSTVTSSVFAWRFLPLQEPMSSRLPPYFDPTSELYADAIKYVMPDSFSTSPTSAAASLTALARATPTLRTRNATVATPSQTTTHAVTTPTSSAKRAPPRKRSRMTRSGMAPTVSAPKGAL